MKKLLVTLIALGFSGVAMAGISTTNGNAPHNFSDGVCRDWDSNVWTTTRTCTETWLNGTGDGFNQQVCKACHVPHEKTDGRFAEAQLWNHNSPADATMYNEAAVGGPFGTIDYDVQLTVPSGTTKLCLGCHDGSTSLDAFGGHAVGTVTIQSIYTTGTSGKANLGTDLTKSHPVSMPMYDTDGSKWDTDLQNANYVYSGESLNAYDLTRTGTLTNVRYVQCSSCHEPHGDRLTGKANLLVMDNTNSRLCITCHNK